MGNKQTTTFQFLQFNQSQWQLLQSQQNKNIYSHKTNPKYGEVNLILANPYNDINMEMEIYAYRKVQDHALVQVYSAEIIQPSQTTICGNQINFKVMFEYIPVRLQNMPQLTFPECIYVLSQSLRGYRQCYSKVGRFIVNNKMIGVNFKGYVKVWLNQNYAENHPDHQIPLLQIAKTNLSQSSVNKDQEIMIKNIMEVIQDKCQDGSFPLDFKQKLSNCLCFEDAYRQIQNYCTTKNIWIPDSLSLSNGLMASNNQERLHNLNLQHIQSISVLKPFQFNQNLQHSDYIPNNIFEFSQIKNKQLIKSSENNMNNPTNFLLAQKINEHQSKQIQLDSHQKDTYQFFHHYSKGQQVQGDSSQTSNRIKISTHTNKIPLLGFYSTNHPANIHQLTN